MARRFIFLSVALATIFISIIARAGSLALDSAGNLFVGEGHSVIKYAPDGAESIFAEGLNCSLGLTFDPNGNLFVADGAVTATRTNRAILKFATDGTRSTFATGISSAGLACDSAGDLLYRTAIRFLNSRSME